MSETCNQWFLCAVCYRMTQGTRITIRPAELRGTCYRKKEKSAGLGLSNQTGSKVTEPMEYAHVDSDKLLFWLGGE